MDHSSSSQSGQLPHVAADVPPQVQQEGVARGALPQNLTPEQVTIQQAQGILMNISHSPHDMTRQFVQMKEGYISATYGVTIE